MSSDPNKKSARSFQCRDVLWETFEQMARELECSVDYLINEAMKQYARQRSYGTSRTPFPGNVRGEGSVPPPSVAPPREQARDRDYGAPIPPPPASMRGGPLPPPPSRAPARGGNPLPPPPARGGGGGMASGGGGGMHGLPAPPRGGGGMPPQARSVPPPAPRSVPPPLPRGGPPPVPANMGSAMPSNGGYSPAAQSSSQLNVVYQGEKVAVTKDRFVIGRGKQSSDLTLKDPNVSRQHAMIEFQNGVYFMVDMGSTNGVEFNGQRIARKQIAEGDIFRICDHDLRFTYR